MNENKIYVGNLSYNTTEQDLETEFSKYGELQEVKLISDMETGRSKGFAFLTYKTQEAMEAALEKNGEEIGGRALRVNKAEERKPRTDRGNRDNSGYGNRRY
ncbi:RNA-binding protein [bacterium]|nr:RNA-binding protein [bacterium]MBT4552806.1 RNA-binding protein [bacterium]MBT5989110.1 RNA-binding protein [bacterium]MBT7088105.1 RNA-binding protein [bacterium]